jgi:hypothetical protein
MSVNQSSQTPVSSLWLVVIGRDLDNQSKPLKKSNTSKRSKRVISCPIAGECERDKRLCLRYAVCGHEGAIRVD